MTQFIPADQYLTNVQTLITQFACQEISDYIKDQLLAGMATCYLADDIEFDLIVVQQILDAKNVPSVFRILAEDEYTPAFIAMILYSAATGEPISYSTAKKSDDLI